MITYKEMPIIQPVAIPTKEKGLFGALFVWLFISRKWTIMKDWHFKLNGMDLVIPKGFIFNGASIPKYFWSWVSPTGILLISGMIHDYGFRYGTLLKKGKKSSIGPHSMAHFDKLFLSVNIDVNGFKVINYVVFGGLRAGSWFMWNRHRKKNLQWKDDIL